MLRRIKNENQLDVVIQFVCRLGLIFVLKKNNVFFHFNRTAELDQSILIVKYNSNSWGKLVERYLSWCGSRTGKILPEQKGLGHTANKHILTHKRDSKIRI